MTDVLAGRIGFSRPFGVHNEFAFGVDEGEERQTGAFATELFHPDRAVRGFELLVLLRFLNDESNENEMAVEDWFDLLLLDKLIEPLAPPSPGCTEIDKNALLLLRCLLFGLAEQFVSTRCRSRSKKSKHQNGRNA